jgi:hypothetical protein
MLKNYSSGAIGASTVKAHLCESQVITSFDICVRISSVPFVTPLRSKPIAFVASQVVPLVSLMSLNMLCYF